MKASSKIFPLHQSLRNNQDNSQNQHQQTIQYLKNIEKANNIENSPQQIKKQQSFGQYQFQNDNQQQTEGRNNTIQHSLNHNLDFFQAKNATIKQFQKLQSKKLKKSSLLTNKQKDCCQVIIKRKNHNFFLYVLIILAQIFSLAVYVPIMLDIQPTEQFLLTTFISKFVIFALITILNLVNSYILVNGNIKSLLIMYFLLDSLMISCLATIITMCVLHFVNAYLVEQRKILLIIVSFLFVMTTTGNFRIMMRGCIWKKWQLLVYKSSLILSSLFYLFYGCYLLSAYFKFFIQGFLQIQLTMNFVVLFACAQVSLYSEMISKMSDFDGTAQQQYKYLFIKNDDNNEEDKDKNSQQNQLNQQVVLKRNGN